jgi:hypothetical protein
MPNDRVLPVLLQELAHIPREQITLIDALGTHRPNTSAELERMLSREVAQGYRIVQHDCMDREHMVYLGKTTSGHDIRLNRTYMEADVKILTGFVEPHLFAAPPPGFETDGTPKVVVGAAAAGRVVWSMCDYGCLWQGERRGRAASREEIRTAMEWGANVVTYALNRLSSGLPSPQGGSPAPHATEGSGGPAPAVSGGAGTGQPGQPPREK